MVTTLLTIVMAVAILALAIIDGKKLVFVILMIGGVPVSILIPGPLQLGPLGDLGPQAAYLFVLALGLFVSMIPAISTLTRVIRAFWVLAVFLLYASVSISWSLDRVEGVRFLVKLLTPLLVVVAVAHYLRSSRDVRTAENCSLVCAGSVLALAVVNHISRGAIGGGMNHWIATGILTAPYMSPANFSFLMGVGALIYLARFMQSKSKASLALSAIFALVVLAAFTRISMGALVVSGCLVFFLMSRSPRLRYLVPAASLLVGFASVFVSESIRSRMFYSTVHADTAFVLDNTGQFAGFVNTSGRLSLWQSALDYFHSVNRLLGAGLGSTDYWLRERTDWAALHSEYLRLYIDTGFVGLTLYLLAITQMLLFLWRERIRGHPVPPSSDRQTALSAGLLTFFFITAATDNSLNYVSEFGIYVFAALGYAAMTRLSSRATNSPGSPSNRTQGQNRPRPNWV